MTLRDLGDKIGASFSQVQKLEKGDRRLSFEWKNKLAIALECHPDELESAGTISSVVPVVGKVGAGARVFGYDDHAKGAGFSEAERPPGLTSRSAVALEVEGESMMPLLSDGWLIYYDDKIHGVPQEYLGSLCVLRVAETGTELDGAVLVKKVMSGKRIGYYDLHSLNPSHDVLQSVRIEWSAKVKFMGQR